LFEYANYLSDLPSLEFANFSSILINGLLKNPHIRELKHRIQNFINAENPHASGETETNCINPNLEEYIKSVINVPLENFLLKYDPSKNDFLRSVLLSESSSKWSFLKEFKLVPVIYQFDFIGKSYSYIGSTKDLYRRCYTQHRIQAFTHTNKHKLFYKKVVSNGWSNFKIKILFLIPNHVYLFA
jgi:hypothetical protein